jgi:mRNA interferase RelE/StbE
LPELRLTRSAEDDLGALPAPVREAVAATIDILAVDHAAIGKQLRGRLRGWWSARVGNYRVLYTIERSGVVVRAIQHRGVAYRGRRRR